MKRQIANELTERKALEMAAVWGNPNYDPQEKNKEGARQEIIQRLNDHYDEVIYRLYSDEPMDIVDEEDYDPNDPFWAAMERGMQKYKLPEHEIAANIAEE